MGLASPPPQTHGYVKEGEGGGEEEEGVARRGEGAARRGWQGGGRAWRGGGLYKLTQLTTEVISSQNTLTVSYTQQSHEIYNTFTYNTRTHKIVGHNGS